MSSNNHNDYDAFSKNELLAGLKPEEIRDLYAITKEIHLEEGETLLQEGQMGNELYFVIEGTLEVAKKDPEHNTVFVISYLHAGEVVGELAFVDREARSASVRAKTKSTVRSISFEALEKYVNKSSKYSHIYVLLSKNISRRLRYASNFALESLRKEVYENKIRIRMGNFIVYTIICLSLFAYALDSLQYLITVVPNTTYIALPFTMVVGVSVLYLIKLSQISWSEFGIRLTNWRQALFEGVLFSIPVMILGLIFKYIQVRTLPAYYGRPIFEPFSVILDPEQQNWRHWIFLNLLYWFIVVPLQELISRGVLQGLLEHILVGRYRVFTSIVLSNLIFSTFHIYFSLFVGAVVFFAGLVLGYIYSRSHNLLSSCIAHAIMGTWYLSVVGAAITKGTG